MSKPDYNTSLARMAGNIAAGLAPGLPNPDCSPSSFAESVERISKSSVALARAIVAEIKRTEPPSPPREPHA